MLFPRNKLSFSGRACFRKVRQLFSFYVVDVQLTLKGVRFSIFSKAQDKRVFRLNSVYVSVNVLCGINWVLFANSCFYFRFI